MCKNTNKTNQKFGVQTKQRVNIIHTKQNRFITKHTIFSWFFFYLIFFFWFPGFFSFLTMVQKTTHQKNVWRVAQQKKNKKKQRNRHFFKMQKPRNEIIVTSGIKTMYLLMYHWYHLIIAIIQTKKNNYYSAINNDTGILFLGQLFLFFCVWCEFLLLGCVLLCMFVAKTTWYTANWDNNRRKKQISIDFGHLLLEHSCEFAFKVFDVSMLTCFLWRLLLLS